MLGRMRQTLFDILQGEIRGKRFADLYAGTGAVGIEALSRGAESVVFVESSRRAVAVIKKNLSALGVQDRAQVRVSAVKEALGRVTADIFFLGPPYEATKEYFETLGTLGGSRLPLVIAQHGKTLELAARYGYLERFRVVKVGSNRLAIYRSSCKHPNFDT